jgi:hypothetical protein
MESEERSKTTFRERALEEIGEFVLLTAYFYVCFATVLYYRAAALQAEGISYEHFGLAIVKASLCAKFVLTGHLFHIGERFKNLPLVVPTLYGASVFLLVLAVLTLIEEILVGAIHGRTTLESISAATGGSFHQLVATMLMVFLILIPYFALRALGSIVGEKILLRLFFERRHGN